MILDYYNLKAKELFDNYQRLEQHKSGYKASKYPRKYGLYLRKKPVSYTHLTLPTKRIV